MARWAEPTGSAARANHGQGPAVGGGRGGCAAWAVVLHVGGGMSTKHTPGPWTQGTTTEGKSCVWLAGHVEPQEGMGPDAAWIDCNSEANARLIAAAPDLLEACLAMIEWDDREKDHAVDFYKRMELCEITFQKARAAIAKAKGEQG